LNKTVSIVIPMHNSARTIGRTLEACINQELPGAQTEIIVVDDGSTDKSVEIAEKLPVKVLRQENRGPAAARNRGWREARGKIICFTDSDCVPQRDWIQKLLRGYDSPKVGGVGGTYAIMNRDSVLASAIHEEIALRHQRQSGTVDYLGSFNLSYKKSVLEEVGGFNEEYTRASGEDNDLAYRVTKKGYRLAFVKNSAVAHYHPDRLLGYLRQQFWHGCWRMKIYKDHPEMTSGDSYGGMYDLMQPPMALLILLLCPLGLLYPVLDPVNGSLVFVLFLLQIPPAHAIVGRTGDRRHYRFAISTFLRGFSRGLGMLYGVIKFRPFLS